MPDVKSLAWILVVAICGLTAHFALRARWRMPMPSS